jgi:hypothetical protein
MLERAIPIQHPRIAFDARGERAPAGERTGSSALLDRALREIKRVLRFLARLAEAGGPLS